MVCADTALTCAVRELNETLQAGPEWYEWLIPSLVSAATFVVALLSYGVSRRATAATTRATAAAERSNELAAAAQLLAEGVRDDGRVSSLRQERDRFAEQVRGWTEKLAHILFVQEGQFDAGMEIAAAHLDRHRLVAAAVTLDSPKGLALIGALDQLFLLAHEERVLSDWSRWFTIRSEFVVRGWQQDPERDMGYAPSTSSSKRAEPPTS